MHSALPLAATKNTVADSAYMYIDKSPVFGNNHYSAFPVSGRWLYVQRIEWFVRLLGLQEVCMIEDITSLASDSNAEKSLSGLTSFGY